MGGFRLLVAALAIPIGVLVAEPFFHLTVAFAQGVEQAARLHQQVLRWGG